MRALFANKAFVGVFVLAAGLSLSLPFLSRIASADDTAALTGGTSPDDESSIAEGKRLFTLSCATEFCHGPNGTGKMFGAANATKLNDDKWYYSDGSYASVIRTIKDGLPGSPMEPWEGRMGMERIRNLAAYILTLKSTK
jgi:cytochrome c oxidase cbb3-type subunit 3